MRQRGLPVPKQLVPLKKRICALFSFLNASGLRESGDDFLQEEGDPFIFTCASDTYLVLTYEEAQVRGRQYIRDSLWAFNAGFLTKYMNGLSDGSLDRLVESFQNIQEKMCEDCNEFFYQLVKDRFDDLVKDAIGADGVAHFLNTYDGKEHEQDGFLIYRIN